MFGCAFDVLLRPDELLGTREEVGDEATLGVVEAAMASVAPSVASPTVNSACCLSVLLLSNGEEDMANTMRWSGSSDMTCGRCAVGVMEGLRKRSDSVRERCAMMVS